MCSHDHQVTPTNLPFYHKNRQVGETFNLVNITLRKYCFNTGFSKLWVSKIIGSGLCIIKWSDGCTYSMYLIHVPSKKNISNLQILWDLSRSIHAPLNKYVFFSECSAKYPEFIWCHAGQETRTVNASGICTKIKQLFYRH